MSPTDTHYMQHALRLAGRGLGLTAPNPTVGCVIVKDGQIAGRGWTQPGGRPHAETEALKQAGELARGATAYVSLEPCSHHGKTPPCSEALIAAGIRRVVVACEDSNPKISGNGIAQLKAAGIEITIGICKEAALALNAGFFARMEKQLPIVNLKIATSLDGKIAYPNGTPRWITGEAARIYGHKLRAEHDAIVTGIGTAITDNPELTCRIPGLEHASPIRVLLDSTLLLPEHFALAASSRRTPTWIMTTTRARKDRLSALEAKGVRIIQTGSERIAFEQAMKLLAAEGINHVLLEGGTALSTSALASGLISSLFWFRAPAVIGDKGKPAFASPEAKRALDSFRRVDILPLKEDVLETYQKAMMPFANPLSSLRGA